MRLYIIGNGFDRNHDLHTSYWDYRSFLLRENPSLVSAYEFGEYFRAMESKPNTRWNDLETGLELFYESAFEDIVSSYYPDMNSERTPGWNDINIEVENRFSFLQPFTGEYFYRWISSVEEKLPSVVPKYMLSPEDAYVTFNYTRTLETVYRIPSNRVLHIHGVIGNPQSIQFGNPSNVSGDMQGELETIYSQDESYIVALKPAITSMARFADSAYKNILSNMTDLICFLRNYPIFDEIIIMGHTLGGIDQPYYSKVFVPNYRGALWTMYVFDQVAEEEACRFVSSSLIPNYQFAKWV